MYYGKMTSRRDTRRILCEENSANIFLNTNRTNLTNLVGCDMVYIRGIREICGRLNTLVILHPICSMALCKPAATELESKNTHGVSDLLRSLFTDLFFDFFFDLYFDFRLIVP